LVVFLVYGNALPNPFLWDDLSLVKPPWVDPRGAAIQGVWARDFWASVDAGRRSGYYRPLISLSYAIEHRLWGERPWGYRLTNLAVHGLNACLVRELALLMGVGNGWALFAGLYFAVHPIHTESVSFISGRTDVFATAGILAALVFLFRMESAPWRVAGLPLAFALGLGSKELAVTVPLLVAVALYCSPRLRRISSARRWLGLGGSLVLLGAYLALRARALGGTAALGLADGEMQGGLLGRAPPALAAISWRYLCAVLFPADPTLDHDLAWGRLWWRPEAWAGFLLLAFSLRWALRRARDSRGAMVVLFWWVLLLPAWAALVLKGIFAERLVYGPSFAVSIGLAMALERSSGPGGRALALEGPRDAIGGRLAAGIRRVLRPSLGLLLVGLAVLTVARNSDWSSAVRLWSETVRDQPESFRARINLGAALRSEGRIDEAIAHFRRAVELNPGDPRGFANLAASLTEAGRPAESLATFQEAAARDPGDPKILVGMARAFLELGLRDDALKTIERAVEEHPERPDVRFQAGLLYMDVAEFDLAVQTFRELTRSSPHLVDAWLDLGVCLAARGDRQGAMEAFRKVLRIDPRNALARANLETVATGQALAVPQVQSAVAKPTPEEESRIRVELGNAYLSAGLVELALAQYERAVALDPSSLEARNNLAIAYVNVGRPEDARREWERILEESPDHESARRNLALLERGRDAR
jgi:tetratricopeptide (TPR) repeat protein